MSCLVRLAAADGHRFTAWRSEPAGRAKGGIVVLHAVYGLALHIGDVCDRWAEAGYSAIAPALFDRVGRGQVHPYNATGGEAGRKYFAALGEAQILADVAACRDALRGAGKVAISGFCSGGSWAWTASARLDFDAQVNFYGSHVPARLDQTPRCPTIMHYGDSDHVVPMEKIALIRATHPAVTIHVYPGAKHAFLNPEQTAAYSAAAAPLAWQRSVEFLDRTFGAAR